MNREKHIIISEFILILFESVLLWYLLREYGSLDVLITVFCSIGTFLFGCTLPDIDHHKVCKFLAPITTHRGHLHSIMAACVYGAIIYFTLWILQVNYRWLPAVAGAIGYFSHLAADKCIKLF